MSGLRNVRLQSKKIIREKLIFSFSQLQPKGSAQVIAGPAVTSLHLPQRLFIEQGREIKNNGYSCHFFLPEFLWVMFQRFKCGLDTVS